MGKVATNCYGDLGASNLLGDVTVLLSAANMLILGVTMWSPIMAKVGVKTNERYLRGCTSGQPTQKFYPDLTPVDKDKSGCVLCKNFNFFSA